MIPCSDDFLKILEEELQAVGIGLPYYPPVWVKMWRYEYENYWKPRMGVSDIMYGDSTSRE